MAGNLSGSEVWQVPFFALLPHIESDVGTELGSTYEFQPCSRQFTGPHLH